MSQINSIKPIIPELPGNVSNTRKTDGAGQSFVNFLSEVNQAQQEAGAMVKKVANGEVENLHEAMLASEKAGISFQLLLEFRNKVYDSYQELMRMRF